MAQVCWFSATASEIPTLRRAVESLGDEQINVLARTKTQIHDQARERAFVVSALASDVLVLELHGGPTSFPAWDHLIAELQRAKAAGESTPWLHIQTTSMDESGVIAAEQYGSGIATGIWQRACLLLARGGVANTAAVLTGLVKASRGEPVELPGPQPVELQGITHPRLGEFPTLESYLPHVDPTKPTVGILMYQIYWLNDNRAHVDALINALEERGANVIAVYGSRYVDARVGNLGADDLYTSFFTRAGEPVIDVLINTMAMSMTMVAPQYNQVQPDLGVPVLQALTASLPRLVWEGGHQGLASMDVAIQAAQPELDGNITGQVVACREEDQLDPTTGALISRLVPVPERVGRMADYALRWAKLRRADNSDKKIGIVFHHHPPRNDRIGCASGLDTFESVRLVLERLRAEGYTVGTPFESAQDLAEAMLTRLTCDQRWLTPDTMHARAEAHADRQRYQPWHDGLPERARADQIADWGPMPGELFVHNDELSFAGLACGNVFITIQPPRGDIEKAGELLHSEILPPPHHYLAHYRWLRDVFGVDALIHMGTHGSLEWLPGKGFGLSQSCYPDLALLDVPNLYPYIINNPGEGAQAKRRSSAVVVDHLTPPMRNADLYDETADLERVLEEIAEAKAVQPERLSILYRQAWEAVVAADLQHDLELEEHTALAAPDAFLHSLHGYLTALADREISDGLHFLGQEMNTESMVRYLAQLTRLENPCDDGRAIPSLRESIMRARGVNPDDLYADLGRPLLGGRTAGSVVLAAHALAESLLAALAERGFDVAAVSAIVTQTCPDLDDTDQICEVLNYVAESVVPRLRLVTKEMDSIIGGLAGQFVDPGPSGAPTRGHAEILPTGRNFFSLDPATLPSPAAWEIGKNLAHQMIDAYQAEHEGYPDNVGILVYGTSNMRTHGEDIAEILYLWGLEPVWGYYGRVTGLRVIPLSELGRPRIDVTPRVSGFFRDAFPNLIELLDDGAAMIAALEEAPADNFVRAHVLADSVELSQHGLSAADAWRAASLRIYGCQPGTYGAGVAELVEAKAWQTKDDLGNAYIAASSYAYGRKIYGKIDPAGYRRQLSRMDVTVKNMDTREYDILSCVDYYNYYGGMIAAATVVRGQAPMALVGDSSDPGRTAVRSTDAEAKLILRSRILNPTWIEGLMRHGYKGAGDLSKVMDILIGWDATADIMADWMYQRMADRYALDERMQEWFREVNPYALQNITDKLLEAAQRGMWDAPQETLDALARTYVSVEGDIEDAMDDQRLQASA